MLSNSVATGPVRTRAAGRLEPCAGKLACTVLRGGHAGNGVVLPDRKARQPYEFGVKASLAITHRRGLIVGARTFPGNPYDGHILAAQLEQTGILLEDVGRTPKQVIVDLGYRGVDADNPGVEIVHRGRFRSMTNRQLCAAGYNLCWLLRAIVAGRIKRLFFALHIVVLQTVSRVLAAISPPDTHSVRESRRASRGGQPRFAQIATA